MVEINNKNQINNENNNNNSNEEEKSLILSRIYVFFEIMIVCIITFVFRIIFDLFISFDPQTETDPSKIIGYHYLIPTISVILASILGLFLIRKFFLNKEKFPNPKNIPPMQEVFSTLKVTKKNILPQIKYSLMLLFLVFIPIDFIAYSIPTVLDFSIESFSISTQNQYFSYSLLGLFLINSFIIHSLVSFKEELFFRGICVQRGRKYIGDYSSVILLSIAFGLSHFSYLLNSTNISQDILPATVWGLSAMAVGIAQALFLVKKRYLWPLIIAHWLNNVISSTALWLYNPSGSNILNFGQIALKLYLPLLIIGIILGIVFRKSANHGLREFFKVMPEYFKENQENHNHKSLAFFSDIGIGLLIWLMATLFIG